MDRPARRASPVGRRRCQTGAVATWVTGVLYLSYGYGFDSHIAS